MDKHKKRACALLLVGLLLILSALGIHLAQIRQDAVAGQTSALLLQQLELNRLPVTSIEQLPEQAVSDALLPPRQYMGYSMIGSLKISSVGIRLPVLGNWNEEMLKVAPCLYRGSLSGGNMIIMGHNYKSHFTPLRKVQLGDEVVFTNTDGKVFRYRVEAIEILHRNEGEKLDSEYPLSIFTCTPGGINRFVARCQIVS